MATPVKRPSGRDEIVDAVLDAAERLFAGAGPGDVSLRAIAAEAGVNYGLVHRHFGSKDRLFEQLLVRYADRWADQLGPSPDYGDALERLLGPSPDTGAYLRLLAWTLLSDRDGDPAVAPGRHATLDRLAGLRPEPEAATTTAAALALIFGWRFFHPFIVDALHLDATDQAELHAAMGDELRRLIGP